MKAIADSHTHTFLSDGSGTAQLNAERASELGLKSIAITDHLCLPYALDPNCECSIFEGDLPEYVNDIEEARKLHPELEIVYGFEADWYEGCEANIKSVRGDATFLLGSVHFLHGWGMDDPAEIPAWESADIDSIYEDYFTQWARACKSSAHFDSMAHPDLVKKFAFYPSKNIDNLYDLAVEAASLSGVHIEVSSAGLRYPCKEIYPSKTLLSKFCSAGVPITIGSDAHKVEDIGRDLDTVLEFAQASGYTSYDYPLVNGGFATVEL